MDYFLHILIMIGIYVILSESLNLVVGYTGQVSLSHAALFGVGAYVAGLMALKLHTPFWEAALVAIVFCSLLGFVMSAPSLRSRGDYFVIVTFSFQIIIQNLFSNWLTLTGGPMGIPGIPNPAIGSLHVSSQFGYLVLVTAFASPILLMSRRIVRSPFGRVLMAIREDELLAMTLAKRVNFFKIVVFMISAGMAGMAGVLYAYYFSFVDPSSFTVLESVFILSIVIIGGAGSIRGPIVGAVLLVALPEILRVLGISSSVAGNIRQILYGTLLVAFMILKPSGLCGAYGFEDKLETK